MPTGKMGGYGSGLGGKKEVTGKSPGDAPHRTSVKECRGEDGYGGGPGASDKDTSEISKE